MQSTNNNTTLRCCVQELRQTFVHFAVSEKGPKWVCLLSMEQSKMGGCFQAIKMVLFVPKEKKNSNKKETNKHLIRAKPFILSALRSWMNHSSLALVGEYRVLHKQVPQVNLGGSCIYLPFSQKGKPLCPETSTEQKIPTH